jgi:uncharacterized phosphatase
MRIYIIRHGSTDRLEKGICQPDDEPLSETGQKQARALAKRFEGAEIDVLVSSSLKRARETAQGIAKEMIISPLFREITKPKEVVDQPNSDPEMKKIKAMIKEKYVSEPEWHYSDEENFIDMKERGLKALDYLISLNKENVLVVSHAHYICLLFGLMMEGTDLTAEMFLKIEHFLRMSNTGINIAEYKENKWILHSWNDTAHCLE